MAKSDNAILVCIVGGIVVLMGILNMIGYFVPSIECLGASGTRQITTQDTIVQIVTRANCHCDTSIFTRNK